MIDWYELHYEYEGCIDWGGVGHDSGWTRSDTMISATSDEGARRKASAFIRERRERAKPCGSYGCSNRGRTRVIKLMHITHGEEEIPLPKKMRMI